MAGSINDCAAWINQRLRDGTQPNIDDLIDYISEEDRLYHNRGKDFWITVRKLVVVPPKINKWDI